ncbi:MAG: Cof-type HAD-IIB family hydrolase [Roseburia sp.]|nr:Cof-type HAD-IIB family hydrolase [Roseburia sp.]
MKNAVFFDIDGTLWDNHMHIPESAVSSIRRLRENGNLAFICSGRSRASICTPELLAIDFDGIVASLGTHIEYQSNMIFEKYMDQAEIENILNILHSCKMRAILEGREYLYVNSQEFTGDYYIDYLRQLVGERFLEMKDTRFFEVNKLSADLTGGDIEAMKKALLPRYDLIFHGEKVVEIAPKGYSKAVGIEKICKYLGVARENTYAFGDSANDLEMISYAAHGIAMGNGTEEIKQAADYVTDSVERDGIEKALMHFGLI